MTIIVFCLSWVPLHVSHRDVAGQVYAIAQPDGPLAGSMSSNAA